MVFDLVGDHRCGDGVGVEARLVEQEAGGAGWGEAGVVEQLEGGVQLSVEVIEGVEEPAAVAFRPSARP